MKKYDFIEEVIREVLVNKEQKEESTDRIDRLLTHRFWGFSDVPLYHGACLSADIHAG